ncbi:MAG: hypothetical protein S0880_06345 [Actinomycetota bacterium]|nr:hypothetical protein [Actinomycetota bacterium]
MIRALPATVLRRRLERRSAALLRAFVAGTNPTADGTAARRHLTRGPVMGAITTMAHVTMSQSIREKPHLFMQEVRA